jgi:hypothetical protein
VEAQEVVVDDVNIGTNDPENDNDNNDNDDNEVRPTTTKATTTTTRTVAVGEEVLGAVQQAVVAEDNNKHDRKTVDRTNHHDERRIITEAIRYLENIDCTYADLTNITIVTTPIRHDVLTTDTVCRYNEEQEQYYIHEKFFEDVTNVVSTGRRMSSQQLQPSTCIDVPTVSSVTNEQGFADVNNGATTTGTTNDDDSDGDDVIRAKAYLLGMYMAKAHPYGKVLTKYLLRNRP